MPQQGGPPGIPSAGEVEEDVEGQDDPDVEGLNAMRIPEGLNNAMQELLMLAREILDNLNNLGPEPPEVFNQRPQLEPPGGILRPGRFFERAILGDNFGQRPQPVLIPFWPDGLFRRPLNLPVILIQPVRQRLNIEGMIRHQIHRAVMFERPNNENYVEDNVEADQRVQRDEGDQSVEAGQHVEMVEGDQHFVDADQRVPMAAEADQVLMASESDHGPAMAAESDHEPAMAAEDKVASYTEVEVALDAEANKQIAIGSEDKQTVAEMDQKDAIHSTADRGVAPCPDADREVAPCPDADREVAPCPDADQEVAHCTDAD